MNHNYGQMHPMELVKLAIEGDLEASEELIDRQQEGKSLRLYPNGRKGPDDEGVCPVMLKITNDGVVIKSGKPDRVTVFSRKQAWDWVLALAESMARVILRHSSQGLSDEAVEMAVASKATNGFGCKITRSEKQDSIDCLFTPVGEAEWVASVDGVMDFIQQVVLIAAAEGWDLEADDKQLMLIKPYLAGIPDSIDQLTGGEDD